jgi:hypothetical protein
MEKLDLLISLVDSNGMDESAVDKCLASIDIVEILQFELESAQQNHGKKHHPKLAIQKLGLGIVGLQVKLFECMEKFSGFAEVYSKCLHLLQDVYMLCQDELILKGELLEKNIRHMVTEDFDYYISNDQVNICFIEFFASLLSKSSRKFSKPVFFVLCSSYKR